MTSTPPAHISQRQTHDILMFDQTDWGIFLTKNEMIDIDFF